MMSAAKLVCGVCLIACSPAFACDNPALPAIPDGEELNRKTERAVKADVIRYITEMGAYVACAEAAHRAAVRDGVLAVNLQLLASRNNAAVAEIEAVKDAYVAKVGPFEEIFFEQPFDSGDRRVDAAPQFPVVPLGHERVLRRAEHIEGDCGAAVQCTMNKEFVRPGAPR